ncbi:MAG: hypothetical protein H0V24_01540 [Chloroflexia bacterium]|nr:hypothetical protein [Chloroflexia bacterium]
MGGQGAAAPRSGVQFQGTVAAGQTRRWFTHGWPPERHVVWNVVPVTPRAGEPQIRWEVQVERAADDRLTYWIVVTNLGPAAVDVEGRFTVLN